jgi:ribosomal protein S18 acetylase RimI-like enzyme
MAERTLPQAKYGAILPLSGLALSVLTTPFWHPAASNPHPPGALIVTVVVEATDAATSELAAALRRLLPQLNGAPAVIDIAALERVLAQPAVTLLVARNVTGEIVGTATVVIAETTSGWVARLEDVVVDDAARGQGIGAALTRAAVQLSRERGVEHLDLTSAPHREAANRLYQRLGFERRTTNVYRHPLH